jgi:hypothetical protein
MERCEQIPRGEIVTTSGFLMASSPHGRDLGRQLLSPQVLAHFRFGAHDGLKPDIA